MCCYAGSLEGVVTFVACEYMIFERLPDGTLVRHGSVYGLVEALQRLFALRISTSCLDHQFFSICSPALN